MKAAFDAFKLSDDETDKQGLTNALRLVFYNLAKDEIEKIADDIYTEKGKMKEENTSVFEALDYFERHPEITNEKRIELKRSSSVSLPQRPLLRDTRQPMSDDCIARPQSTAIGTPCQSQLAVQQGFPAPAACAPLSQEMSLPPPLPPRQSRLLPPPMPLSQQMFLPPPPLFPSQQGQQVIVVNHYIQERLNKDNDEDIGKFGVASRNILVDNPKLEAALSAFLANKEASSKELFYKKIGGINYCTTLAATCEQVPSLICTLFEKFAEAKQEYIEIENTFLDKRIKKKGRYTESIRHDPKAVEQAATAFHTSPDRIQKLFSLYLAHRIIVSELLEKAKAYDEASGNVVMSTIDDVTSNLPTDFVGLAVTGIKAVSAAARYAYYKKMSDKQKELARHYIGNIFAIQRFLNVMGCIASLFDVLSHKRSFDHAMCSNVLVCHVDERRITDVKEQLEHYDHNHGCFCGFLDRGEACGETMQQWVAAHQPVWSRINGLFGSKDALKSDDGSYYYIDYDTLGERLAGEELFAEGFAAAKAFRYHPLLSPLLDVGLSVKQIDTFKKIFGEVKAVNVLYDTSSDEKSARACHKRIDGKGPTITFAVKGDKIVGGIAYQNWTAGNGKQFDEFIRDAFAAVFCITRDVQVYPVKCYDRALYGDVRYGTIFGFFELVTYPEQMSIAINNDGVDYTIPSSFKESFYEPDEAERCKVDRIVVLSFEYDSEKLIQRMFNNKEKAAQFIKLCGSTETAERTLRKTRSTKEAEELVAQCSTEKEIKKALDGLKQEASQSGFCGDECGWVLSNDTLFIGGKGEMKYTNSDAPWSSKREQIKSIVIGGITTIRGWVFSRCSSLTSITIPNSVTTIGDCAFKGCPITSLSLIGTGEMKIKPSEISTKLTTVVISERISTIRDRAFSYCSSLTSVTIPNSVTTIGEDAFSECFSLTSITIPNSVTTIGKEAFRECSKLTSITIPDSVTTIGEGAFSDCSSLTSVTIPNSVTTIGDSAFSRCSSLKSINVSEGNQSYKSKDGVLYKKDMKTLVWYPAGKKENSFSVPNSVTTIGKHAFSGCSSLTSITIPDSVKTIGEYAFSSCSSLTSITIPNSVKAIGESAFSKCSSLTSITIPDSVTMIEAGAFSWCRSLTSIIVSEGNQSFKSKDGILYTKDMQTLVCYPAGKKESSFSVPNSVTTIGKHAFSGCSSLTSITIPDSVKTIGEYAFSSCSSLTSVAIPDSITTIGYYAFSSCSSLTSVAIPDSITTIGYHAFSSCSSLTATLPKRFENQKNDIFDWCDNLQTINWTE